MIKVNELLARLAVNCTEDEITICRVHEADVVAITWRSTTPTGGSKVVSRRVGLAQLRRAKYDVLDHQLWGLEGLIHEEPES